MSKTLNKKIQISLVLIATMGVMSGITVVSSLPLISKTFSHLPHIEFLSKLMLTIPSIISIAQLFYSTAFIGIGFGLILVNTNSWFLSKVPAHKRGKASGVLASSFFLGQFSSPLLLEPIVHHYGIQGLFLIVSCIALMISLTLFLKGKMSKV